MLSLCMLQDYGVFSEFSRCWICAPLEITACFRSFPDVGFVHPWRLRRVFHSFPDGEQASKFTPLCPNTLEIQIAQVSTQTRVRSLRKGRVQIGGCIFVEIGKVQKGGNAIGYTIVNIKKHCAPLNFKIRYD